MSVRLENQLQDSTGAAERLVLAVLGARGEFALLSGLGSWVIYFQATFFGFFSLKAMLKKVYFIIGIIFFSSLAKRPILGHHMIFFRLLGLAYPRINRCFSGKS